MVTIGQFSTGGFGLFELGILLLAIAVSGLRAASWQFLYEVTLMTEGDDPWRDAIPRSQSPRSWRSSTWGGFSFGIAALPAGVVLIVAELVRNPSLLTEAPTEVTMVRAVLLSGLLWHASWFLRFQTRARTSGRLPALGSKSRLLLWRSLMWVNIFAAAVGGSGLVAIIFLNV